MTPNRALEIAAKAWTTEDTSEIAMDDRLCGAFADILIAYDEKQMFDVGEPQPCCMDWANCKTPCIPLAEYWKERAEYWEGRER